jgi:ribosomal protein S18 acetylase RimI-like enzyme
MEVRRMRMGEDLGNLIALSREFFAEYQRHDAEFFAVDTMRDDDIVAYFLRFLGKDDHAVFIAVSNEQIVGYITVCVESQASHWRVKRVGHISGLMVRKGNRRERIGTQLLEHAKAYFREHGLKYYTVSTAVQNREALEFYQRRGLEPLQSCLVGVV